MVKTTNRIVSNIALILRMALLVGWTMSHEHLEAVTPNTEAEHIERARQATVGILKGEAPARSPEDQELSVSVRGTGIHIGQGYIVTARHAVEQTQGGKKVIPELIRVITDDLRELPASRKGANAYLDVALYQLSAVEADWPQASVSWGEDPVTYGDTVFTVGFPLGWGPAISFGRVGNPNTFLPTLQSRLIQVDISACQGNSGGGLLNREGKLVGLVHAIIQTEMEHEDHRCSRFAFALPGVLVKRVATALMEGRVPGFSVLGFHLRTVSREGRWVLAIDKVSGPSRHAGFRKEDVLLTIDGIPITSSAQLKNYLIEQTQPGQTVKVRVRRDDQEKDLEVILGGS